MPHDRKGNPIEAGDHVIIPAIVQHVTADNELCNLTMTTEEIMPGTAGPNTITLNTQQVEKL
jgi:hypothetical protein